MRGYESLASLTLTQNANAYFTGKRVVRRHCRLWRVRSRHVDRSDTSFVLKLASFISFSSSM